MIKRIPGLAQKLWHDFLGSIKRFPEAIIFAVTTVVLLIVMNHWQTSEQTTKLLTRLAMTLAFGFPIALSLNVLFEHNPQRRSKPMIIFSLALVVLAAYFIFFLKEINPVSISRYIAYSLSSYLAFVFIPYLSHRKHFELSVIELLTRFCITFLYSATLFLGLSAILFTVDQLFAMGINSKPYFDLWLIMAGIFAPVFFLAKIPVPALDSEPDSYPKVLKALFLYILIPLLSVYTIILFTYFAKIIITQTWPIGLVSHLVLWYAVFSALLIFCLEPLSKQSRMAEQF
ncbi:MAG TPA: DUF4153 domain-containing protein, partial [Syntrophomonas sp.]|nr:DUF4153 domain-containing protein [Syntrophomonas sp.]